MLTCSCVLLPNINKHQIDLPVTPRLGKTKGMENISIVNRKKIFNLDWFWMATSNSKWHFGTTFHDVYLLSLTNLIIRTGATVWLWLWKFPHHVEKVWRDGPWRICIGALFFFLGLHVCWVFCSSVVVQTQSRWLARFRELVSVAVHILCGLQCLARCRGPEINIITLVMQHDQRKRLID